MLSQLAQQGFMRHFLWCIVASVILVTTQVASVHGQLTSGLQSYWPLDGNGDDQIGSVNLSASGNAGFDNANPLAGSAAAQTTETAGNFRAGWVSANGHGSTFNVTNEYTISSWYRLDSQGSGGEKSSFRQLHFDPPTANAGLEQSWGWFSPDTATTYNARVVTNAGATTQNNMSFGTPPGVWNHVVQRMDTAGNLTFWHEAATATDHSGADNTTAIADYTAMDTTNMVNGQILTAYYETKGGSGQVSSDEVAIWNRALSNTEIEQLFDNGKVGIAITGASPPAATKFEWNQTGLGDWNRSNNWTPAQGTSGVGPPNNPNHTAVLGTSTTGDSTVVVDSPVTVNRIEFINASNSYAVGGKRSVNLMSTTTPSPVDPTIDVQGNHEFQAVVQLHNNTIAKVASGSTLTFNNALDLNGQVLTKMGDGELVFNNQLLTSGGMVLGLEGTISGAGTIGGDLDNQSGTVSPGGSSVAATTQVPEPTSCLLLVAGALVILFTYWSRGGFLF